MATVQASVLKAKSLMNLPSDLGNTAPSRDVVADVQPQPLEKSTNSHHDRFDFGTMSEWIRLRRSRLLIACCTLMFLLGIVCLVVKGFSSSDVSDIISSVKGSRRDEENKYFRWATTKSTTTLLLPRCFSRFSGRIRRVNLRLGLFRILSGKSKLATEMDVKASTSSVNIQMEGIFRPKLPLHKKMKRYLDNFPHYTGVDTAATGITSKVVTVTDTSTNTKGWADLYYIDRIHGHRSFSKLCWIFCGILVTVMLGFQILCVLKFCNIIPPRDTSSDESLVCIQQTSIDDNKNIWSPPVQQNHLWSSPVQQNHLWPRPVQQNHLWSSPVQQNHLWPPPVQQNHRGNSSRPRLKNGKLQLIQFKIHSFD